MNLNLLSFTGDESRTEAILVAALYAPHTIEAWSFDRITRTCLCVCVCVCVCVFVCTRALVMRGCVCMLTSFFHETADLVEDDPAEATATVRATVMMEEYGGLRC